VFQTIKFKYKDFLYIIMDYEIIESQFRRWINELIKSRVSPVYFPVEVAHHVELSVALMDEINSEQGLAREEYGHSLSTFHNFKDNLQELIENTKADYTRLYFETYHVANNIVDPDDMEFVQWRKGIEYIPEAFFDINS